ncbi:MAG: GNAT family N-acetyltransferase [Flavisolibacter sp.]
MYKVDKVRATPSDLNFIASINFINLSTKFPELQTPRFLLTRIHADDQQFLFEGLSDPVSMPYNGIYFKTFEETKEQLEWYEKNYQSGTGVHWKIVDKNTREKIGVISYYYYKSEHKKAEVGFWLLNQFWNKGITTEVLKAVIEYCHNVKGIHRLEAFIESENMASARVLEKNGFVLEGTMRDAEIKFGKYISLCVYSLLLD